MKHKKILFVCTHSFALRTLYKRLFPFLTDSGYSIEVVTGDDDYLEDLPVHHFGEIDPKIIEMKRLPSAMSDLKSLWGFFQHFRKNHYDLIHTSTPKASLLVALTAKITGQGPVVFVYRRCIYEHHTGVKRKIYQLIDQLIASQAKLVLPISRQLSDFIITTGIAPAQKVRRVGIGSSNGIDTEFFSSTTETKGQAAMFRKEHGLTSDQPLLMFLGRVIHEKGIDLLPDIFERVKLQVPDAKIVIAGPEEGNRDPIGPAGREFLDNHPDVIRVGYVADPRYLFEAANVFCFPSHFEGFGNVMLEAGAMGTPCVGFDVPGVQEAISHGTNGFLSSFPDTADFAAHISTLLTDQSLHENMRKQSIQYVQDNFGQEVFFEKLKAQFETTMGASR